MRLLLDTHIWLWSLAAPDALSRRVRNAVGRADTELWLSPISVWELLVLAERGRLKFGDEPRKWVRQALDRSPVREAALNHEVAIRSREVSLPHADPAHRFLAATALTYDLTLVTADETLIRARPCRVLSNR